MEQNAKINQLEKRIKGLERKINGGSKMSKLIDELIGQECTVIIGYETLKCQIIDVDDEWVKLLVHEKKADKVSYRQVSSIDKIELEKWA
jgi:hypothetical protein